MIDRKMCPNCDMKMLQMASIPYNLDDVDITKPYIVDIEEIIEKVMLGWYCKNCYHQENE